MKIGRQPGWCTTDDRVAVFPTTEAFTFLPDYPLPVVTDLYGKGFRREDPPELLVQRQDSLLEVSAPGVFDVGEKDAAAAVDFSSAQHYFLTQFDSPWQSAHSVAARNFTRDWFSFLILGIRLRSLFYNYIDL